MKEKETGSEWKREKSRTSKEEERSVSEGEKKQAVCSHLLLVEDLISSIALFALMTLSGGDPGWICFPCLVNLVIQGQ